MEITWSFWGFVKLLVTGIGICYFFAFYLTERITYKFKEGRLYTLIGWTLNNQTLFEDADTIYKWKKKMDAPLGSTFRVQSITGEGPEKKIVFEQVEIIGEARSK